MMNLWKSGEPLQWFGHTLAKFMTAPLDILDTFKDVSTFYNKSDHEYNPVTGEWGDKQYRRLVNEYKALENQEDTLNEKYEQVNKVYNQDYKRATRTDVLKKVFGSDEEPSGVGVMLDVKDSDGDNIFNTEDVYNILNKEERVK